MVCLIETARNCGPFSSRSRFQRALLAGGALLVMAALVALPAAGQRGAHALQRNLAQLVSDSHTILRGRVLSVHAEPHPQYGNLMTVVVTLEVLEVLKGQVPTPYTFRQFVVDSRDAQQNMNYRLGQEVFLMLTKPSPIGLCSPAGLEQGRFRFVVDAQGNRLAVNGYNNMGLFRNIDKSAPQLSSQLAPGAQQLLTQHRSGPISYDQLRSMIQALMANPTN